MSLPRREFLLLAKTLKLDQHDLTGWFWSEKLDGMRAFWDGGVSRGLPTTEIPWANILHPRTQEPKKKIKPIATGLWSRYGNPIIAPDWFLDKLPLCPLDGELWAGRKHFQLCRSICAGDKPDARFKQIRYAVFDTPPLDALFRDGEIKNANFWVQTDCDKFRRWFDKHVPKGFEAIEASTLFSIRQIWLKTHLPEAASKSPVFLVPQYKLDEDWRLQLDEVLTQTLDMGGEGLVLRDPLGLWEPKRVASTLKYKPFEDAEATIVGIVAGRRGRTDQVLGKIGSLVCETRIRPARQSVTFEVGTGLTMEQRELTPPAAKWAKKHPGESIPHWEFPRDLSETFRLGDQITFKYRELSDDGVPKEPRFWRCHRDEN